MNIETGSGGAAAIDPTAAAGDYVIAALRRLHCTIVRRVSDTCESSPIEAWKATDHLLMCLRVAMAPSVPADLTPKEVKAFRKEAARANAEPWVAKVALGPDMELVEMDWWPLEQHEPAE